MTYLYLGPGIGGGALAIIIGVIVLIVITFYTFIWFPLKKYLRKRKEKNGS